MASKPKAREKIGQAAENALPPAAQRSAPPPDKPKPKPSMSTEEHADRYGKVTCYRFTQELRDAIASTAENHNVSRNDLVTYLVVVGLADLESGELNLPVSSAKQKVSIPPVPSV